MNNIELTADEELLNRIVEIPWASAAELNASWSWRSMLGFIEGAQAALISVDVDRHAVVTGAGVASSAVRRSSDRSS